MYVCMMFKNKNGHSTSFIQMGNERDRQREKKIVNITLSAINRIELNHSKKKLQNKQTTK